MSSQEFERLMRHTFPKALDTSNQNGIGLFETEHTRGIIRFGARARPGHVNIEVWSREGQLHQGILVHESSAEAASRIVHCVLEHLRYSVDRVPPADTLRAAIRDSLESHPLFVEN
jgi:hypothetical protein